MSRGWEEEIADGDSGEGGEEEEGGDGKGLGLLVGHLVRTVGGGGFEEEDGLGGLKKGDFVLIDLMCVISRR